MIEVIALKKSFAGVKVLHGLDLTFASGKVTALIGPNGSGKTTLIKSILGLTRPDEGIVSVDGSSVNGTHLYRQKIGYMPQRPQFPPNLTVEEVIAMVKEIRNAEPPYDEELLESFHLDREWEKPIRTLSGGTRQKLNAALAFLFSPEVLIMDEPTASLDPVSVLYLKNKIRKETAAGKTILVTSHVMSEIEELSDEVIYLLEGRVKIQGTLDTIREITGEQRLENAVARLCSEE